MVRVTSGRTARGSATILLAQRAVHAQAADAAVGKNIEPQMRDLTGVKDFIFKKVAHVPLQFCARQNAFPDNRQIR